MMNLFDAETADNILDRLHELNLNAKAEWGRMNPAQMLAHCLQPMRAAVGDIEVKRSFLGRILGGMVKKGAVGPKPFSRGLPTDKRFLVAGPASATEERAKLETMVRRFKTEGPSCLRDGPHPFFGPLSHEEWGRLMWKHIDHHLRQFGA